MALNPSPVGSHRKTEPDVYTAFLIIALVALLISTIFLFLETSDYGPNLYRGAPPVVQYQRPSPMPPASAEIVSTLLAHHATPATFIHERQGCFDDCAAI